MQNMVFFNGTLKLKIYEAVDLRPTEFATRHSLKDTPFMLDPYISLDIDDVPLGKTTTKLKTLKPQWEEDFVTEVHNGQNLVLTVFHDAAIPPDEFVAMCTIALEDLSGKDSSEIWVCNFIQFYFCECCTTISRLGVIRRCVYTCRLLVFVSPSVDPSYSLHSQGLEMRYSLHSQGLDI